MDTDHPDATPADSETIAPVSEAPAKRKAKVKPVAPVAPVIDAGILAELLKAAHIAIANGESSNIPDDQGRQWSICPDLVGNNSVVLIQARRGASSAYRNLSTAVLAVSAQAAADAIAAICAELV